MDKGDLKFLAFEHKDHKRHGQFLREDWKVIHMKDVTRQPNGYDCGAYVCYFARRLSQGKKCTDPSWTITRFRQQMMTEILSFNLLEDSFLLVQRTIIRYVVFLSPLTMNNSTIVFSG